MVGDSDQDKVNALVQRIDKAQEALESSHKAKADQGGGKMDRGAMRAVKVASDLVAMILGFGFFGWLADRHFGTAPLVMLIAVFLGFGGGFWILVRMLGTKDDSSEPKK